MLCVCVRCAVFALVQRKRFMTHEHLFRLWKEAVSYKQSHRRCGSCSFSGEGR